MLIKEYKSIDDPRLAEAWNNFETEAMSPFLKYRYVRNVFAYVRCFYPGHAPRIVTVESEGDILMIAPLKVDRFGSKVRMLCDLLGSGKAGFLYNPHLTDDLREKCLDHFFKHIYPGKSLKLRRIDVDSSEHAWLCRRYGAEAYDVIPCVSIDIEGGYDTWFASLSKSVRQNIRTARNRASRDNISVELKVFDSNTPLKGSQLDDVINLYVTRLYSKYRKGGRGVVARFLHKHFTLPFNEFVTRHIKHDTKSLYSNDDAVTVSLYLGGQLAAFMSGFRYGDGKFVVPRLSINDDFSFYSPGYLLISETILTLSWVKTLDLSRGTERYKTDNGGKIYQTASWIIRQDKR